MIAAKCFINCLSCASDEQDMYRLIILNYEDAQKHLLKENESMRKYLKEMQGELISALNEKNTLSGSQEQNSKLNAISTNN